jgi:hypothetical protein
MMERDEGLSKRIIFSDEATFHLSRKANRHNIRIWGSEKPVAVVEMERDSPKVNVFCAVSRRRLFGENGSTAWTSVASHVVRTSNAFKVITKLQTFLFQMPVVSCIFVYYY